MGSSELARVSRHRLTLPSDMIRQRNISSSSINSFRKSLIPKINGLLDRAVLEFVSNVTGQRITTCTSCA